MKITLPGFALVAASLALLSACAAPRPLPPTARVENSSATTVPLRLLAISDLQGRLKLGPMHDTLWDPEAHGPTPTPRPVGGAANLVSWLHEAERSAPGRTLILNSGDLASSDPTASWLMRDEPAVMLMNLLANTDCSAQDRLSPRCNLVSIPGEEDFGRGIAELRRLNEGGTAADGPFLDSEWRGARYPLISANVVDARSRKPVFPPYLIKTIPYTTQDGKESSIPVGIIGATLSDTPEHVPQAGIANLRFLDEARAINRYAAELRAKGIHTIIVLLNEGGSQNPYAGATRLPLRVDEPYGHVASIVSHLDDGIEVVCAGHYLEFLNVLLPNRNGKPVLVTEAWLQGKAFAQIDLDLDPQSGRVVYKTAKIQPTWSDKGPTPDAAAAELLARMEQRARTLMNRPITRIDHDITRQVAPNGETALGRLLADAQREAGQTDFAFVESGYILNDLHADKAHSEGLARGTLTYSDAWAVHHYGQLLIRMTLSGSQIFRLIESTQYRPERSERPNALQVSGLTYRWRRLKADLKKPETLNQPPLKLIEVLKDGKPINRLSHYSVTITQNLATAGGGWEGLADIEPDGVVGGDLDALIAYLARHNKDGRLDLPDDSPRVIREPDIQP